MSGLELAQGFRYGTPGYFLKFERACTHLQSLAIEGEIFVHNHLHPGPPELVEENGWTVVKWSRIVPPPAWWSLLLGDFIHNLRGCLDHLVFALVVANNGDPGTHTSFPICETETQWTQRIEQRLRAGDPPAMTEGVSEAVLGAIRRHQPFNRDTAKARENDPLMQLLRMSNTDKHRELHISAVHSGKIRGLHFVPPGFFRIKTRRSPPAMGRVEEGAVIVRMRVEQINPVPDDLEVGVKYEVPAKLAFTEPRDERVVTLDDMFEILNAVLRVGEDLEVHLEPPETHLRDLADSLALLNASNGGSSPPESPPSSS